MEYYARFEKAGELADQDSYLGSYKLDLHEGSLYDNEIAKNNCIDLEFLNQENRNENENKAKNNGSEICQNQIQIKKLKVIGNANCYISQIDQQPTNAFTGASLLNTKQKENNITLLNKKKKMDKGYRKDTIMQRVKANLFKNINKQLAELRAKSNICLRLKLYFREIKSEIYKVSGSKENIELLEKKLKDVLCEVAKENKEIIDKIMTANDCPALIQFLEKTINEILDIFCGNIQDKEGYYKTLVDGYKKLIKSLEKTKSEEYISKFREYSEQLLSEYNRMIGNGGKKNLINFCEQ